LAKNKAREAIGRMIPDLNKKESEAESSTDSNTENTAERIEEIAGKQLRKYTHEPISVRIHKDVIERFDHFCKDRNLKKGEFVQYALTKLMNEIEETEQEKRLN